MNKATAYANAEKKRIENKFRNEISKGLPIGVKLANISRFYLMELGERLTDGQKSDQTFLVNYAELKYDLRTRTDIRGSFLDKMFQKARLDIIETGLPKAPGSKGGRTLKRRGTRRNQRTRSKSKRKSRRAGMPGKNQITRAQIRPVHSDGQPVVVNLGNIRPVHSDGQPVVTKLGKIHPVDPYGRVVYNPGRTMTPPGMFRPRHTNSYSRDASPLHEEKKSKKNTSSSRRGGRKKRQKTKKRCGL
mgnify:CR=1 FL=1